MANPAPCLYIMLMLICREIHSANGRNVDLSELKNRSSCRAEHNKGIWNGGEKNERLLAHRNNISAKLKKSVSSDNIVETHLWKFIDEAKELRERLSNVNDMVLVVDTIPEARRVVGMLTNQYKYLIHACHIEVASIDVKEETPVDHGEIICFSIYSGLEADFHNGKSCVWIDVLGGGGKNLLDVFAPFFEDPSIKKVWHNYSFDNHMIENYGLRVSGFFADTMHMAWLWNSSRQADRGYSLEALTGDLEIMSDTKGGGGPSEELIGKVSVENIFGRRNIKKDGSKGKSITVPPADELQRDDKKLWICYCALKSISTLKLYQSLERKLLKTPWSVDGHYKGSMFNLYETYLRPFGELLVKMETEGVLVDHSYLAEIEKVARADQQVPTEKFRKWASKYWPDAKYMKVGSEVQLRQMFFGGIQNRKNQNEFLPMERDFEVPCVDNIVKKRKKNPAEYRKITLRKPDGVNIETDRYNANGWPLICASVLKNLAGKVLVSADFDILDEENDEEVRKDNDNPAAYGAAYSAFGGGPTGIEACHAIAALSEVWWINAFVSTFIVPLQDNNKSGKNGRIHCSLNMNTETGWLSSRRPNLLNQPALWKDRYKIRQAFIAAPGNSLIVADYGQLELRILAHLANCKSMLDAFKAGADFHSRTAMNIYPHIHEAINRKEVLLEWDPQPGQENPPAPLLKDAFVSERRRAKNLNYAIANGGTAVGLARDWKVSRQVAQELVDLWYSERQEVLAWREERKKEARKYRCVYTLLGRVRHFPSIENASWLHKAHIERVAMYTPVQGSAADVCMCSMLEISKNARLLELGWGQLLQVGDEVILEGPTESCEEAKDIVVNCMSKPFDGQNILKVDLHVDAKCAQNWYSAK